MHNLWDFHLETTFHDVNVVEFWMCYAVFKERFLINVSTSWMYKDNRDLHLQIVADFR